VVKVLLPPTSARSHTVDLLPCGHHYLTSRDALAASGATVIEETDTIMDPAPAGIEAGIPASAGTRGDTSRRRNQINMGGQRNARASAASGTAVPAWPRFPWILARIG